MDVYIFQADIYCESCGKGLMLEIPKPPHADLDDQASYDSDEYPKGPYGHGGGEADSPQNCGACGVFLENLLTPDGDTYMRELANPYSYPADDGDAASWDEIATRADEDGQGVFAEWCRYYFAWG